MLGQDESGLLQSRGQDLRLCFNCGSPEHAVASCPELIDRQVVSLSCKLFNFLHPGLAGQEATRFYIAEEWKQQRLEWLRSYEPGVVRSHALRDALGLEEDGPACMAEWLRNMAYWGYPPGWVGCRDPRQSICARILDVDTESQVASSAWESFTIFDGTDDDEEIDLTLFTVRGCRLTPSPTVGSSLASVDSISTRWATYPNTYFSSSALFVYNGTPLDEATQSSSSRVSVTFTPDRRELWERILSGGLTSGTFSPVPPWRLSGAFGTSVVEGVMRDFLPPPPSTTPPPLPPISSSPFNTCTPQKYPVLSRLSTPAFDSEEIIDIPDDKTIVDMDLSDNSE